MPTNCWQASVIIMNKKYDLVIVGGGMVGASLAVALKDSGLSIAIIEAFAWKDQKQPSFDDRSIALSYGSKKILEAMSVWPSLKDRCQPIKTIHVSDRGYFGATRLRHTEENVEALGYVIENRVMGEVLQQQLQAMGHVDVIMPATVTEISESAEKVSLVVEQDGKSDELQTSLLVAADGAMSKVRSMVGISHRKSDYEQSAVIANITTEKFHDAVAYERFTDTGPLAFLPMTADQKGESRVSVVWTIKREDEETIMQLDDEDFLKKLQQRFGYRLGRLQKTGVRNVYPLALTESEQLIKDRVVIIGNAAHGLHPVSGQGFNLALRDVALLAEKLSQYGVQNPVSWLSEYATLREKDMSRVFHFTDSLVKIFSNKFMPLAHARAAGLMMVDCLPSLRHLLAKQSMGMLGKMSRMMRGLSLR